MRMAALRPLSTGSVWFGSRAKNPRGTLPPGRAGDQDTRLHPSFRFSLVTAEILPSLGPASPEAARACRHDALARNVLELGARNCCAGASRRFAVLRAGGERAIYPGELTDLIKDCTDVEELMKLVEDHGQSFNIIHVSVSWRTLARIFDAGAPPVAEGVVMPKRLTGKLMARALAIAGDFKPQDVSNILWALATLDIRPEPRLLEAMQRRALATEHDFIAHNVAMLLWALATMGIEPEPFLLKAMQRRVVATADDFDPQNVSMVLWALATMGIEPEPRLLKAMQRQAMAKAGLFIPQNVANVLWAMACFDTSPSHRSVLMVECMADRILSMREQLGVEEMTQIHQWLLFCDLHPEWRGKLPRSMREVEEEHGDAFRDALALASTTTSRLQVSSHRMYELNGFRKSTAPQNRQLIVYYYESKR